MADKSLPVINDQAEYQFQDRRMSKQLSQQQNQENINTYYKQLDDQVTSLDSNIDRMLYSHEQDFLSAFKSHMHEVYQQLSDLKKQYTEEDNKFRRQANLASVTASLEWFQNESVKLNELVIDLRREVEKWKSKALANEDERKFLEHQLKLEKKATNTLKIELGKAKPMYDEPSYTPPGTAGSIPVQSHKYTPPPTASSIPIPAIGSLPTIFPMEDQQDTNTFITSLKGQQYNTAAAKIKNYITNQEAKYKKSINHYRHALSIERRRLKSVGASRGKMHTERNDLENLFVQCVEEVKKANLKRTASKQNQVASSKPFRPDDKRRILEMMLSNDLVLALLYEILFPYKDSSIASLSKSFQQSFQAENFSSTQKVLNTAVSSPGNPGHKKSASLVDASPREVATTSRVRTRNVLIKR